MEGDEEDDDPDALAAVPMRAVPEPTRAQTLEESLSGRFAHLRAIAEPPSWLAGALEEDVSRLHGELMAFHWEDWGWHCCRLSETSAPDLNVTGLYEGQWREGHALRASDYGVGGVGSWVLLEPHRPASPLLDFANGKYKVTRDGAEVWLRGNELIHHSGAELRAAREAKKREAALASQQAAEMELDTGDHSIGSRVFARGQGGDGEQGWFVAQVVGHRERYPPYASTPFSRIPLAPFSHRCSMHLRIHRIQIKYLATHPDGETSTLALPIPRTCFVPATHVTTEDPM